jgi:hypothetical protein
MRLSTATRDGSVCGAGCERVSPRWMRVARARRALPLACRYCEGNCGSDACIRVIVEAAEIEVSRCMTGA